MKETAQPEARNETERMTLEAMSPEERDVYWALHEARRDLMETGVHLADLHSAVMELRDSGDVSPADLLFLRDDLLDLLAVQRREVLALQDQEGTFHLQRVAEQRELRQKSHIEHQLSQQALAQPRKTRIKNERRDRNVFVAEFVARVRRREAPADKELARLSERVQELFHRRPGASDDVKSSWGARLPASRR